MSVTIGAITTENGNENVTLLSVPDECPQCHSRVSPERGQAFMNRHSTNPRGILEVMFRCPHERCREVFVAYYSSTASQNVFKLEKTAPASHQSASSSETIRTISGDFIKIYDQAHHAEELGLDQICGVGYRRALEFLIKDYLLAKASDEAEKDIIRKEFLGTAISKRITDTNIKGVAKRAVWLGNDEAHYIRKWEQKDLNDLKKLIALTVHWMEAEALTDQLYKDMPDTSGPESK
jgi:hypothetical protein